MSKKNSNPFRIDVSENCYLVVVWAKTKRHHSASVVEFSADQYIDGVKFATINKLSILNTISRNTNEPVTQIGSMYCDTPDNRRVFSLTFYPGSKNDENIEDARAKFAQNCVDAVTAFIDEQNRQMQEQKDRKAQPNPQLNKLKQVSDESNSIRSMYFRR